MNKKIVVSVVVVGIIAVTAIVMSNKKSISPESEIDSVAGNQRRVVENVMPVVEEAGREVEVKETVVGNEIRVDENIVAPEVEVVREQPVKEFSMTSFVEMVDGQPKPQYSLKEMKVKKGDKVRVKITMTKGMHDFKIDEFGVYSETPLNQETTVEFTADKVGEFIYYCTKPGHRQNGHWGTLTVTE